MEVSDSKISVDSDDPWDVDSVEIYVDRNLSKGFSYDQDDGQYRVDAEGNETVGENDDPENFKTSVVKVDGGYVVEARIKMETKVGKKIGFDIQVNNDAGEGYRQSIMKWNDSTDQTYQSFEDIGELEMVGSKEVLLLFRSRILWRILAVAVSS